MTTRSAYKPARKGERHRHPLRWEATPADKQDTVHANWNRFLRANPNHRLAGNAPNILCLIRHIALNRRGYCSRPGCPGCTRDARMRWLLDHQEPWQCAVNGKWRPATASHPYISRGNLIQELKELLNGLGTAGIGIRAYVSPAADGWYMPPAAATLFLQPAEADPIPNWTEVRGTGNASDEN